jgi:hypothetical protein
MGTQVEFRAWGLVMGTQVEFRAWGLLVCLQSKDAVTRV